MRLNCFMNNQGIVSNFNTQNHLLLNNMIKFYKDDNRLDRILPIINGTSTLSIRIIDWFVTNYSKKNFTLIDTTSNGRFKVYNDYKLKLKAYSKKRFDPFCRWERINIPYKDGTSIQTTIGQLNFFKWALENEIIQYIENHMSEIESDMNSRNSSSKRKDKTMSNSRKKREELSISAAKSIKKEEVQIIVKFD